MPGPGAQSPDHFNIPIVIFDAVVANTAGVKVSSQSTSLSHFLHIDAQLRETFEFVIIVQIVISRQLYHSQLVL